jgi:dipeptidyl aminopeptidase/acylaminoacyl peptidase
VPYQSAVRFHAALTKAGVPNQLFPIPGGKHGGYAPETNVRIYEVIRAFLAEHHVAGPEKP